MVFIGAFFLMNLTLAVINAAFTKSQKEASAKKGEKYELNDDGTGEEEVDLPPQITVGALFRIRGVAEICVGSPGVAPFVEAEVDVF